MILGGFFLASYVPLGKNVQMSFVVLTAFLYVVWGVLHHTLHHSFSLKVMLEYIAIATFGISVALFFFNVAL